MAIHHPCPSVHAEQLDGALRRPHNRWLAGLPHGLAAIGLAGGGWCTHARGPGGDIISTGSYTNFELTLEWKISEGGNSGIFYRASEDSDAIYWNAPEMQVLDDAKHPDGRSRLTAAGSDYAVYPSPAAS